MVLVDAAAFVDCFECRWFRARDRRQDGNGNPEDSGRRYQASVCSHHPKLAFRELDPSGGAGLHRATRHSSYHGRHRARNLPDRGLNRQIYLRPSIETLLLEERS